MKFYLQTNSVWGNYAVFFVTVCARFCTHFLVLSVEVLFSFKNRKCADLCNDIVTDLRITGRYTSM